MEVKVRYLQRETLGHQGGKAQTRKVEEGNRVVNVCMPEEELVERER